MGEVCGSYNLRMRITPSKTILVRLGKYHKIKRIHCAFHELYILNLYIVSLCVTLLLNIKKLSFYTELVLDDIEPFRNACGCLVYLRGMKLEFIRGRKRFTGKFLGC